MITCRHRPHTMDPASPRGALHTLIDGISVMLGKIELAAEITDPDEFEKMRRRVLTAYRAHIRVKRDLQRLHDLLHRSKRR